MAIIVMGPRGPSERARCEVVDEKNLGTPKLLIYNSRCILKPWQILATYKHNEALTLCESDAVPVNEFWLANEMETKMVRYRLTSLTSLTSLV